MRPFQQFGRRGIVVEKGGRLKFRAISKSITSTCLRSGTGGLGEQWEKVPFGTNLTFQCTEVVVLPTGTVRCLKETWCKLPKRPKPNGRAKSRR